MFKPSQRYFPTVLRAITRDPDVYPEPDVFSPERFLNPNGTPREDATLTSVFGFGKRVCPGRHFVDTTMFIVATTVLSVCNIERRGGSDGSPFNFTYSGGLVRCVKLFAWRNLGRYCLYTVDPIRSHVPSAQGTREQRSSLILQTRR